MTSLIYAITVSALLYMYFVAAGAFILVIFCMLPKKIRAELLERIDKGVI